LFGLLKKKMHPNTLAAVCPEAKGVAVAQIRRDGDVAPLLEFCEYHQLDTGGSDKAALEKLVKEAQLDRSLCVSLVELGDYSLVMVEAPDVQPEEVRGAIRWRIKDLIDFNIDDAVIDVFEVPNTKAGGKNAMVYAVVARAAEVKQRIERLLGAGLNLEVVDIPELALRNIAALLPEDVAGVALVYIGQDNGLITITRQQTLYLSRRLASGVNALPDTLMQSNDQDTIENWLDGIIVEIQRSLDYYESHFSLPQVSSLVITPLPRELPGVAQYISDQLDISTRMLDVQTLIDSEHALDSQLQSQCLLAIGAALRLESASP
jgi:MSHA biogenesis protein MshI